MQGAGLGHGIAAAGLLAVRDDINDLLAGCARVDDEADVLELAFAARRHGTVLEVLVEIDCGAGRCGAQSNESLLAIAQSIARSDGLTFAGMQAYHGGMQHAVLHRDRQLEAERMGRIVRSAAASLQAANLPARIVTGGGTGSLDLDLSAGVLNEVQCGSYAFLDASYGRVLGEDGVRLDESMWENALFILTSVMSHAKTDRAVCDAGLKSQSVDSGLPAVFGRSDVRYAKCTDEHGELEDPGGVLKINEKLRLVPGHCDPTCNLHDWYVGVRRGVVEAVWPVSARGKSW